MRTGLSLVVGLALALVAPSALAQDTQGGGTAGGTAGGTVEPPKVTPPPPPPKVEPAAGAKAEEDTTTDHEKFVGHFAIGYLGLTNLPLGGPETYGDPTQVSKTTLAAPVIGGRYWVNKLLGIDVGLGFGLSSSSTEAENPNNTNATITNDGPSALGLAIHGGVPLALATGKHYTFEAIPEVNVGFTTRTIKSNAPQNPPPDIKESGFRLDIGARVGAEVHFGFIGLPELALQATVGLQFQRLVWHASRDAFSNTPQQSSSQSSTGLGTTVQSDPWALFVNNISALYYF